MARFKAPRLQKPGSTPTINVAGGQAFDRTPKIALASLVLTSMVQDTYYESASDQLRGLAALADVIAKEGDLRFLAKAALYTRHEHGLRSISHALAGEVARLRYLHPNQRGTWGPGFFERIVFRLDDAAEIAAFWLSTYAAQGKPKTLPNAMKRGFARVLAKAKPELLRKWGGSSRGLTLRQLAHLVHPAGPAGSAVHQLRGGALGAADTHEVVMTRAGQAEDVAEAKREGWARLFAENKIKYMAALRGARRILKDAPECIDALCAKLASQRDIEGSKVLPFQLLIARQEIEQVSGRDAQRVIEAIDKGMDLALANVPTLPGKTLIAVDGSGSMTNDGAWIAGGVGRAFLIAAVHAAALARAAEYADVIVWENGNSVVRVRIDPKASLGTNVKLLRGAARSGGTDMTLVFRTASDSFDRVVILSDEQSWAGPVAHTALEDYRRRTGARPMVYDWNVVGSKTCQFPESQVVSLAGLTPRVFDLMKAVEQDPNAMVAAIEAVTL